MQRIPSAFPVAAIFAAAMLAAPPVAAPAAGADCAGVPEASVAASLPRCGDPAGWRRALAARGIEYALLHTQDVLSNLSGGLRRGTVQQGKLEWILTADLDRLANRKGLRFHVNGFAVYNSGHIRRDHVGGVNTIAAIEAVPTVRLDELWLEQTLRDGTFGIRFGQLAADTEFFFSDLSTLFLSSDWPTIAALALPSGGAAYPLSTPGVRVRYDPTPRWSLLAAVLNGDPAGPGPGDEQLRNRHGLNFRLRDPAFVIAEVQHRFNRGAADTGLAGTLKLGGWTHLGRFDDQRLAPGGLLQADPFSGGVPLRRRGNAGVYGVIEQQLYRPVGVGPDQGISVFGRVSASPSDRNPVDFYADGGIVVSGMVRNRPNDSFGATVLHARFSDGLRAFDRDVIAFGGASGVVRTSETNLELTYRAEIVPGWAVQPSLQYVWRPGGGLYRDAVVAGVRSLLRF